MTKCYLALSDLHGSQAMLKKILAQAPSVSGVLLLGDITHQGGYREAEQICRIISAEIPLVYGVPGNMDRSEVGDYLLEHGRLIHGSGVRDGTTGFFGVGGSNRTPFGTPTEWRESQIADFLAAGFRDVRDAHKTVLISHPPPANTTLDRLRFGGHAGSTALKEFLEKNPVTVCLCGHIHESVGQDTVGNVLCYNIGAVRDGRFAIVEIGAETITLTLRKAD